MPFHSDIPDHPLRPWNSDNPHDNPVNYFWDCSDDTNSGWLGPYNASVTCEANHTWSKKGENNIKVKAKDITEKESV
jgi:hypothetical protein